MEPPKFWFAVLTKTLKNNIENFYTMRKEHVIKYYEIYMYIVLLKNSFEPLTLYSLYL